MQLETVFLCCLTDAAYTSDCHVAERGQILLRNDYSRQNLFQCTDELCMYVVLRAS